MESEKHQFNQFYVEGPHLFKQNEGFESISFPYFESRWKVSKETISVLPSQIEVQRPAGNPLNITIEKTTGDNEYQFTLPEKILVISDIEGNYLGLTSLLKGNSVINEEGDWIYGANHLMMLGDIFDRGPDVTPCLWHLYKLEKEALQAGGKVHILLGNHEIMIFQGDQRYVHRKYIRQYRQTGYDYDTLFSTKTFLGQWLRHKPSIIRIGPNLFTHAGISPSVFSYGITMAEINQRVKEVNLTSDTIPVWNEPKTSILFGGQGPFWYRDWIDRTPTENELDQILAFYGAERMVIGHTIVPRITSLFQNKLLAVDIRQPRQFRPGKFRALLMEKDHFYGVNDQGRKTAIEYDKKD